MADTANAVSSLRETVEDEYNATLTLSLCPLVETDATHDQSAPSVTGASDADWDPAAQPAAPRLSATSQVSSVKKGAPRNASSEPERSLQQRAPQTPIAEPDLQNAQQEPVPQQPGTIPVRGGGSVKVHYNLNDFKEAYLDEYTREVLPHHLVREPIKYTRAYCNAQVWELDDAHKLVGKERQR